MLTRALLLRPTRLLDVAELRPALPAQLHAPARPLPAGSALQQGATELVLNEFERTGSISQTSRNLGISRTTVYRHLREAGIGVVLPRPAR